MIERTSLRIAVLGEMRASVDDIVVNLGSGRQRAVFAALVMRANRGVAKEDLVRAAWGDRPPKQAVGALYTCISHLRALLPQAQMLARTCTGYRLCVPVGCVDHEQFNAHRALARELRDAGDVKGEREALERALALWAGPALAGVPGPLAVTDRTRLHELRIVTAERHAVVLLKGHWADEAVHVLTGLVRRNPLRESLCGLLMTALARTGATKEALQAYDRLHSRLVEHFGTEPSAGLKTLRRRIADVASFARTRETVLSWPVVVRSSEHALIGRAAELAVVRQAVTDLRLLRGNSIWIEGEAGSGKTALLAAGLEGGDAPVSVHCGASVARQIGGDEPLLVDSVTRWAGRLCENGGAVLVFDDMHTADEETLLVWRRLHDLTSRLPLLLVAASRPHTRWRELGITAGRGVRTIALRPLADEEIAQLAGPVAAARIVRFAGGNPLLAHALTAAEGIAGESEEEPPPSVMAAVRRHLDGVSGETTELLEKMALVDQPCGVGELVAATELPVMQVVRSLAEAIGAGVLVEEGDRVRFRHELVCLVLRRSLVHG